MIFRFAETQTDTILIPEGKNRGGKTLTGTSRISNQGQGGGGGKTSRNSIDIEQLIICNYFFGSTLTNTVAFCHLEKITKNISGIMIKLERLNCHKTIKVLGASSSPR